MSQTEMNRSLYLLCNSGYHKWYHVQIRIHRKRVLCDSLCLRFSQRLESERHSQEEMPDSNELHAIILSLHAQFCTKCLSTRASGIMTMMPMILLRIFKKTGPLNSKQSRRQGYF
jgi:hypothetical protein